jgi:hypothetical protein
VKPTTAKGKTPSQPLAEKRLRPNLEEIVDDDSSTQPEDVPQRKKAKKRAVVGDRPR